jgi:sugar O-acyltransferase (sialic acid O-acetyltransferase NeuD family)
MNKSIVVGAGGHARAVISILHSNGIDEIVLVDESYDKSTPKFVLGKQIVGCESLLTQDLKMLGSNVFLAIGDNQKRAKIYKELVKIGYVFPNLVARTAIIDRNCKLGDANFVGHRAYLGPESRIGSNNIINTASVVEHEVTIGDHVHVAPATVVCGRSVIGSYSMCGAGSCILPRCKLANNTILGAGAVVTKNIDTARQIFIGIPAKAKH